MGKTDIDFSIFYNIWLLYHNYKELWGAVSYGRGEGIRKDRQKVYSGLTDEPTTGKNPEDQPPYTQLPSEPLAKLANVPILSF
jgi:hypothetical protein